MAKQHVWRKVDSVQSCRTTSMGRNCLTDTTLGKGKHKAVPAHAMKISAGSRGMTPLILTLSGRQFHSFLHVFLLVLSESVNFQTKYDYRSFFFFKKRWCPFIRLNFLDSSHKFLMHSHKYNENYLRLNSKAMKCYFLLPQNVNPRETFHHS